MLELFPRLLTGEVGLPAIMLGTAWIGAHHLFIAPEIADRLATLQYIPACIAGLETRYAERLARHDAHLAGLQATFEAQVAEAQRRAEAVRAEIERQAAIAGALVEGLGLGGLVEEIDPDGTFRGLAQQALPQVPSLEDLGLTPPELPAPPPVASEAERAADCVVAADQVLAANPWDMTLYTASATLYAPTSVQDTPTRMIEIAESS